MFTISIHALAKRATVFVMKMPAIFLDFNPRPRKEGDFHSPLDFLSRIISIHALAKRATGELEKPIITVKISIHALAKRATANLYNDYLYFEAKYHISDIFPL